MRMRRADKHSPRLARPNDVVGILALARDEAEILFSPHRRADTRRAHGGLLPLNFLTLLSGLTCAPFGHRFRSGRYCFDNVVVAGAAADVAVELLADCVFVEIVAVPAHDVERSHNHS